MKTSPRAALVQALAFSFCLSAPRDARADEDVEGAQTMPVDATTSPRWEVAAKGGYLSAPIRGGTTPFGVALGGRFGASLSKIYVGASVVGHLGGTDVDITDRSVLYGAELGYGLELRGDSGLTLTLRPSIGLGGLTVMHTDPSSVSASSSTPASTGRARTDVVSSASGQAGASATTDVTTFYVEPSISVLVGSGAVFAGVTTNLLVVPRIGYTGAEPTTWLCYGLQGELGLRF